MLTAVLCGLSLSFVFAGLWFRESSVAPYVIMASSMTIAVAVRGATYTAIGIALLALCLIPDLAPWLPWAGLPGVGVLLAGHRAKSFEWKQSGLALVLYGALVSCYLSAGGTPVDRDLLLAGAALAAAGGLTRRPHPWLIGGSALLPLVLLLPHPYNGITMYLAAVAFGFAALELCKRSKIVIPEIGSSVVRILHFSDIHLPDKLPEVEQRLKAAVADCAPSIGIISGDLGNHPVAGSGDIARFLNEIQQLSNSKRSNAKWKTHWIVIPGNHDLYLTGLFGFGPVANAIFDDLYGIDPSTVFHYPAQNLVILYLDLNPLFAFGSAEGNVYQFRLDQLHEKLIEINARRHEEKLQEQVTKILVTHQHPLPVPAGEKEFRLATRNMHLLWRFAAEKRIDQVLHGHYHHGSWAHLRIGGDAETNYYVETVGAAAAMTKNSDIDQRGHNFNLISISPNRTRSTRQFFLQREQRDRPFEEPDFRGTEPAARQSRSVGEQFGALFTVDFVDIDIHIDEEGGAIGRHTLNGIQFAESGQYRINIGPADAGTGRVGAPVLEAAPSNCRLLMEPRPHLRFETRPPKSSPPSVTIRREIVDGFLLNREMAENRGPRSATGQLPDEDYFYLYLDHFAKRLRICLHFPEDIVLGGHRAAAIERADIPHQEWTDACQAGLTFENSKLTLVMEEPPPFLYFRVIWNLPILERSPADDIDCSRRAGLETRLRSSSPEYRRSLLEKFNKAVFATLEKETIRVAATPSDLTVSIRIRTEDGKQLEVLISSGFENPPESIRVGRGNAGRAFEMGGPRARARESDDHTGPLYEVSLTGMDLNSKLPVIVGTIGARSRSFAEVLSAFKVERLRKTATEMFQQSFAKSLDQLR